MRVRERESEALQIEKRKVAAPVCWFLKVVSLSLLSLSLESLIQKNQRFPKVKIIVFEFEE